MPKDNHADRCRKIHDVGVERHPHSWFRCNVAAVNAINAAGGRAEDPLIKEIASDIVLRVLDAVEAP